MLAAQRARFAGVRAGTITAVEEVERRWLEADPLAAPITPSLLDKLQREHGSAP